MKSKDYENAPESITQQPARSADVQRVKRKDSVVKVAAGTKINQPRIGSTKQDRVEPNQRFLPRPPAIKREPPAPTPPAPKPRKGAAVAKRLGGAGLGILGMYGIAQRRGGK